MVAHLTKNGVLSLQVQYPVPDLLNGSRSRELLIAGLLAPRGGVLAQRETRDGGEDLLHRGHLPPVGNLLRRRPVRQLDVPVGVHAAR